MRLRPATLAAALAFALALSPLTALAKPSIPSPAAIDARVKAAMGRTHANGMAVAVIENGQVRYVQAYGIRNAKGDPLTKDTVMYGASLTKTVFAYTVLSLVDDGRLALDTPVASYLEKPLPEYTGFGDALAPWETLAGDERWRKVTPRMSLTHSVGFANFYFLEPDEKLHFHFEPGSRYAYSGDGLLLLQFVIEKGLGLSMKDESQRRVFDRFGMRNTSLMWRPDFAANLADGWKDDGSVEPHDERSRVRVAGSMDTTINDLAQFAAGLVRGEGLSKASRAEMVRPQLTINTATQFPSFQPELPPEKRHRDLSAGLGVVTFKGPQGPGFYKGGHNDSTGNTLVCVERRKACVLILANDVRAEAAFPELVAFILGDTGVPYGWEYGDHAGKS